MQAGHWSVWIDGYCFYVARHWHVLWEKGGTGLGKNRGDGGIQKG